MSEPIFTGRADRNLAFAILRSAGLSPRSTLKGVEAEMGDDFSLNPYPVSAAAIQYIQNNFFKAKLEKKDIYPLPEFVCGANELFPSRKKGSLLSMILEYSSTENPEKVAILFPLDASGVTSYKEATICLVVNNPVNVHAAPGSWKLVFSDPSLKLGQNRAFCVLPFSAYLGIEVMYD
jgi:hypothetical protein